MLKSLDGAALARWRTALKSAEPARCSFSMPKFAFAPKAGSIKASLQRLGVQTAFTDKAELKPMLGRAAPARTWTTCTMPPASPWTRTAAKPWPRPRRR
ncbi:MAG: serpin family protein [Rubrivivax sp.]